MPTAGELIWSSVTPILKMVLTCAAGFFLTKAGFFPPPASRGFSQICLNVALPGLIFSSIVPSFDSNNISALGPLIMTALFYQATGLCLAFLIRSVLWVPRNFRWGILICGAMSNWGNLPTAIVQSVATKAPFNGTTDEALGVGFTSIFIAVYNVTFFGGIYRICAWDFVEPAGGWEGEDVPIPLAERMRRRRRRLAQLYARFRGVRRTGADEAADVEDRQGRPGARDLKDAVVEGVEKGEQVNPADALELPKVGGSQPRRSTATPTTGVLTLMSPVTRQLSAAETESVSCAPLTPPGASSSSSSSGAGAGPSTSRRGQAEKLDPIPASRNHSPSRPRSPHSPHGARSPGSHRPSQPPSVHHSHQSRHKSALAVIYGIVCNFFTPVTTTLLISLVCALVPAIKALFVDGVEGWSGTRVPYAPDGTPMLAWIQSTAVFLGNITVPGGLILLGASFARLKRPESWSTLPIAAIICILLSKMLVMPVIGVSFIQSLSAHTTLYPKDDRMLRFVAMLLSGTPTAVNQLVVTQLCAPEGGADTLAAFLLPQYCLMFVFSTALTAVSLLFVS